MYGYDSTHLYVNVNLSATITTLPTVDGDHFTLYATIPYNSSNHIMSVGCKFAISAAAAPDTYTTTWSMHEQDKVLGTVASADYLDATNGLNAAKVTKTSTAGASGTAQTFTADETANTNYTMLKTSTANYTESTKVITCQSHFKW